MAASPIGALGIAGDRRFAVRELDTGKILSAKRPAVGRILLSCAARTEDDGSVTINLGDGEVSSADGGAADARLSALLGCRVALESVPGAEDVYDSYWPEVEGVALSDVNIDLPVAMATGKGTFVDYAALHIVTSASLAHLRRLAPESVIDVARFRPNLVVDLTDDVEGFAENEWVDRTARVGTATIKFGPAAPRCVMTTLVQPDLPEDRGVLRTLASHNRLDFSGVGNFACLGIYAEVVEPGDVSVGDAVQLLSP